MEKGLITIIVPIYNAGKFIERCLQSLVSQTYSNIEILCIDDCSTDNSCEIVGKFLKKDNRVKLFKNEKNSGPATTRNIGLKNAQGEFIMFCDNDDEYKQNMCEVMAAEINSTNADLVICKADIHNSKIDLPRANYINNVPIGALSMDNERFSKVNVFVWNKIYRKVLIDKYNISFPDGLTGEDDVFVELYCLVSEKICGIDNALYNHYFHNESYTAIKGDFKSGARIYDRLGLIEYLYYYCKKLGMVEQNYSFLIFCFTRHLRYIKFFSKDKKIVKDSKERYNQFVLENKELPWDIFNYSALLPSSQGNGKLKKINRLLQCIWF